MKLVAMDFLCDEPDDQPAKKAGGSKPKAVKPVLKPCLKKAPAQENTQKKLPAAKKKPAAAAQKKPAVVQKISSSELLKTNADLKRLFQKASRPRGDPPVRGPIYGEALRLGSDCAGLGTDFLALQMLQVPTRLST